MKYICKNHSIPIMQYIFSDVSDIKLTELYTLIKQYRDLELKRKLTEFLVTTPWLIHIDDAINNCLH